MAGNNNNYPIGNFKGRILLCLYPFPPLGGPRSFRWLNMTRILSQRNWSIDVLTIKPSPNDSFYNQSLTKELLPQIRIHRTFPGFYYSLFQLKKRPSHGFPKTTIEWLPFGLRKGMNLVKTNHYQAIISSGLPFVGHLVGYFLKKKAQIPWIVDYGDPFAFNPMTSRLKRLIGGFIEKPMLQKANGFIVPFEEMRQQFFKYYPFLKSISSAVIENGVPETFKKISPSSFNHKFMIFYTGSFYKGDLGLIPFFKALSLLKKDRNILDKLKVIIAGNTEKSCILYSQELGLTPYINFLGHIPQQTVFAILKGATLNLLIGYKLSSYHFFPYKTYEYVASGRPILAIKQSSKDLGADFIRKNNLGFVVSNQKEKIAESIHKLFALWKENKLDYTFNTLPPEKFYWKTKGQQLENFLLSVISANRS